MPHKYWLGKTLSVEHRQKISDSLIGNARTLGYKITDETREKLVRAAAARNSRLFTSDNKKYCKKCDTFHPLEMFARVSQRGVVKAHSWCRPCMAASSLRYRRALRRLVIDKYGGCCACCGETTIEFLAIDHMNNDGFLQKHARIHRGATGWYFHLKNIERREDLQVLCHNCNLAKGFYGQCPHVHDRLLDAITSNV